MQVAATLALLRDLFLTVVPSGSAACTLLTSLDDFAGSPPEADASAPPDGLAPSSPPSVVPDGGRDADGGFPDLSGPLVCPTGFASTKLCSRFDDELVTGFDEPERRGDDIATYFQAKESFSPPRSFASDIKFPVQTGNAGAAARFVKFIDSSAKRTRLSFMIRIDPPTLNGEGRNFISIGEFLCGEGDSVDGVWLQFKATTEGRRLAVVAKGAKREPALSELQTQWTQVTLDVRWDADAARWSVSYDGVTAGAGEVAGLSCKGRPPFRAVVGLSSNVSVSATYDDVILDVE